MHALIMAGGKGKRIGFRSKPLMKFLGKEMISYVLEALEKCGDIREVYVAARKDDVKLIDFLNVNKKKNLKVITTEGRSYVKDIKEIAEKHGKKLGKAIILSCDTPLVNKKIIQQLIKEYKLKSKPAASIYIPLKIFNKLKIKPTMIFENMDNKVSLVPAGINFLDFTNLNASEEKIIVNSKELAFNINTAKELKKAENYAKLLQK